MASLCITCDIEIRRNDKYVKCVICSERLHIKCAKLTDQEMKIINENENINFACKACNKIDVRSQIRELKNLVEQCIEKLNQQGEIIATNSGIIDRLDKKNIGGNNEEGKITDEKRTYAQMLNKNKEMIMIKPINGEQRNDVTRKDIKSQIDPSKLAVGVNNIKNIRNGGVMISCADANSKGLIKDKVQEVLSEKYKVEEVAERNPRIIVVGVEEDFVNLQEEEIVSAISEQNGITFGTIKVVTKYVKKARKNIGSIVLETDPDSYKEIMKREKLKMGWRICNVHDHVNIKRCFNCAGFNHIAKECTNKKICFRCAEEHSDREKCNSMNLKCTNCIKAVENFNIKVDVNHCATDLNCPCYRKEIEKKGVRINYKL